MKKKIRQEFNFLLGGDPPAAKEEVKTSEEKISTTDLLASMTSFDVRP